MHYSLSELPDRPRLPHYLRPRKNPDTEQPETWNDPRITRHARAHRPDGRMRGSGDHLVFANGRNCLSHRRSAVSGWPPHVSVCHTTSDHLLSRVRPKVRPQQHARNAFFAAYAEVGSAFRILVRPRMYVWFMSLETTLDAGAGAPGASSDPERFGAPTMPPIVEQMCEDEELSKTDLVEIIAHCASVRASADYRMLQAISCLLYTSPSPRDATLSRMPSSA